MAHFLDQLGPSLGSWWDALGSPSLTPEMRQELTQGIVAEAGDCDIAALAIERDCFLTGLLALKNSPLIKNEA